MRFCQLWAILHIVPSTGWNASQKREDCLPLAPNHTDVRICMLCSCACWSFYCHTSLARILLYTVVYLKQKDIPCYPLQNVMWGGTCVHGLEKLTGNTENCKISVARVKKSRGMFLHSCIPSSQRISASVHQITQIVNILNTPLQTAVSVFSAVTLTQAGVLQVQFQMTGLLRAVLLEERTATAVRSTHIVKWFMMGLQNEHRKVTGTMKSFTWGLTHNSGAMQQAVPHPTWVFLIQKSSLYVW